MGGGSGLVLGWGISEGWLVDMGKKLTFSLSISRTDCIHRGTFFSLKLSVSRPDRLGSDIMGDVRHDGGVSSIDVFLD